MKKHYEISWILCSLPLLSAISPCDYPGAPAYGSVATITPTHAAYNCGLVTVHTYCTNSTWSGTMPDCTPPSTKVLLSCGHSGTPPYGVANVTNVTTGQQVSWSCINGYALSGNTTAYCSAPAYRWSSPVPVCSPDNSSVATFPPIVDIPVNLTTTVSPTSTPCGFPGAPRLGSVQDLGQGEIKWACGALMQLQGSAIARCEQQSGGAWGWNNSVPVCKNNWPNGNRGCDSPGFPQYGWARVMRHTSPKLIQWECLSGYALTPTTAVPIAECNATTGGDPWSVVVPVCEKLCGNGKVDSGEQCDDALPVPSNATCAGWSNGTLPIGNLTCSVCKYALTACSSNSSSGQIAANSCPTGTVYKGSFLTISPTSSGGGGSSDVYTNLMKGPLSNDTWNATCGEGFTMAQSPTYCGTKFTPSWSSSAKASYVTKSFGINTAWPLQKFGHLSNCSKPWTDRGSTLIDCCAYANGVACSQGPQQEVHVTTQQAVGTSPFIFNTYQSYQLAGCSVGYKLPPNTLIVCSFGVWNTTDCIPDSSVSPSPSTTPATVVPSSPLFPSSPSAYGGQCLPVTNVSNGYVTMNITNTGVRLLTFGCNSNAILRGNTVLTCLNTGKWDLPVPFCETVCSSAEVLSIVHGSVLHTTPIFTAGVELHYTCTSGYHMVGLDTIRCLPNGNWLPDKPPICVGGNDLVSMLQVGKFDQLYTLLDKTGMDHELRRLKDPYTLFAPTDEAWEAYFKKYGPPQLSTLARILKFHLVPELLFHKTSTDSVSTHNTLLDGATVDITWDDANPNRKAGVEEVQDVSVSSRQGFDNGELFVIDEVLLPPPLHCPDPGIMHNGYRWFHLDGGNATYENVTAVVHNRTLGFVPGTTIVWECGSGWRLDNVTDTKAVCQHDETWSDRVPTCEDVNECKLNLHGCDIRARCINAHGGFKCDCFRGYRELGTAQTTHLCEQIPATFIYKVIGIILTLVGIIPAAIGGDALVPMMFSQQQLALIECNTSPKDRKWILQIQLIDIMRPESANVVINSLGLLFGMYFVHGCIVGVFVCMKGGYIPAAGLLRYPSVEGFAWDLLLAGIMFNSFAQFFVGNGVAWVGILGLTVAGCYTVLISFVLWYMVDHAETVEAMPITTSPKERWIHPNYQPIPHSFRFMKGFVPEEYWVSPNNRPTKFTVGYLINAFADMKYGYFYHSVKFLVLMVQCCIAAFLHEECADKQFPQLTLMIVQLVVIIAWAPFICKGYNTVAITIQTWSCTISAFTCLLLFSDAPIPTQLLDALEYVLYAFFLLSIIFTIVQAWWRDHLLRVLDRIDVAVDEGRPEAELYLVKIDAIGEPIQPDMDEWQGRTSNWGGDDDEDDYGDFDDGDLSGDYPDQEIHYDDMSDSGPQDEDQGEEGNQGDQQENSDLEIPHQMSDDGHPHFQDQEPNSN